MRVGVTLPQFRDDPEPAIAAARQAEDAGVDGVFVFDHLWAIGQPERPALSAFPLLGALAAETSRVALGTLVARVGVVPDAVLVHQFDTLHRILGDRLIAGIGTGDRLSKAENAAFGVPYPPAAERRAALAHCAKELRARGITVWVGGAAPATVAVARAHADAVNLWAAAPHQVSAIEGVAVTWGGVVPDVPEAVDEHLDELERAGAAWAVCAAPTGFPEVVQVLARRSRTGRVP